MPYVSGFGVLAFYTVLVEESQHLVLDATILRGRRSEARSHVITQPLTSSQHSMEHQL
jgi:hypothetical protein